MILTLMCLISTNVLSNDLDTLIGLWCHNDKDASLTIRQEDDVLNMYVEHHTLNKKAQGLLVMRNINPAINKGMSSGEMYHGEIDDFVPVTLDRSTPNTILVLDTTSSEPVLTLTRSCP